MTESTNIQALHAGISRRDWSAVETAANALRDELEQVRRALAGTGIGSLPNDYPLLEMVMVSMEEIERLREENARLDATERATFEISARLLRERDEAVAKAEGK